MIATPIPGVEVVLHDLRSQTLVHIAGHFSRHVIGRPSRLDEIGFEAGKAVNGPHEKTNWDGRRIRFKEDWRERIHEHIQNWIREHNVPLAALTRRRPGFAPCANPQGAKASRDGR